MIRFLFLSLLFSFSVNAQNISPVWGYGFGEPISGRDEILTSTIDNNGNMYAVGHFSAVVDFDPGPSVFNMNSADGTVFINKIDASGNFVWAKQLATYYLGGNIAVDASGNVYLAGSFGGTTDLDPGPGNYPLTAFGGSYEDVFVLKLNAAGDFVWAKQLGGPALASESAEAITVDAAGNVYTTGIFYGTADFDPGNGVANLIDPIINYPDVFISKLDPNGNYVWAKQIGGVNNDIPYSINVDASGAVYTTGTFYATCDFDPGTAVFNLSPTGIEDLFISKLDADGNFIWAKKISGNDSQIPHCSTLDNNAAIYITGEFSGTTDFNPAAANFNLTSAGGYEIFVCKLDSSGSLVWAKQMGGTSNEVAYDLSVSPSGNVYTTGYFLGTADFDPDASTTYNLTTAVSTPLNTFISELDNNGNFIMAKNLEGVSSGQTIDVDALDNIYIGGMYTQNCDIDPSAGVLTLVGQEQWYQAKLNSTQGINESGFQNSIHVFPNPTTKNVSVSLGKNYQSVKVNVYDLQGKKILSENFEGLTIIPLCINAEAGIYFLQVISEKGETANIRLVKE